MVYTGTLFCFSSLSDGKGGEMVLEVKEAHPEVVRKSACGAHHISSLISGIQIYLLLN
jgi:hypothetical protein